MEKETGTMEKYMIREAAKQVGVEPPVLRYWEKELSLEIPKNEMGHRYYTMQEITLLRQVKYLKDQGFHLKSVRMLKDNVPKVAQMEMAKLHSLRDRLNGQLMAETAGSLEEASTVKEWKEKTVSLKAEKTGEKKTNVFPVKGTPAGMPAGKIVGTRLTMITNDIEKGDIREKDIKDIEIGKKDIREKDTEKRGIREREIGKKDIGEKDIDKRGIRGRETGTGSIKTQLLELELAEPKTENEQDMPPQFNVVQGGSSNADKSIPAAKEDISNEQTTETDVDGRMAQFRMIMNDIIGEALRDNNKALARDVGTNVSEKVIKEVDFMMRSQQEEEEKRYRKLDETIRSCQKSRQEAAAAEEGFKRKRRKIFSFKRSGKQA